MINVVTYCRHQTDGEHMAYQRFRVEAYAVAMGWEITQHAEDLYITDGTEDMPGLHECLALLEPSDGQPIVNCIVVSSLNRISMKWPRVVAFCSRAFDAGWHIVALDIMLDTTQPAGYQTLRILRDFYDWDNDTRTLPLRSSRLEEVGRMRKNPNSLNPTDEPLPRIPLATLTIMADMRRRGHTYRDVAHYLKVNNFPTARGGEWGPKTISVALEAAAKDGLIDLTPEPAEIEVLEIATGKLRKTVNPRRIIKDRNGSK